MTMEKFITNKCEETYNYAKNLAKTVPSGTVVELIGDMGAGKTIFAKGFADGLGIKDTITSPTYTILNIYKGDKVCLNHFDLYRIEEQDELYNLGFSDMFFDKSAICLVEWPQIAEPFIPKTKWIVTINKIGENSREIILEKK